MNSWENYKAKKWVKNIILCKIPDRLCTFQEENISLSEFHQSTHRTIKKEHVNFPSMQPCLADAAALLFLHIHSSVTTDERLRLAEFRGQ